MIQAFGNEIYKSKGQNLGAKSQGLGLILKLQEVQNKVKHPLVSAKHVGLNLQAFVINLDYLKQEKMEFSGVFINAEIITEKAPLVSAMEDDLSLPRLAVSIERPKQIEVSFLDEHFKLQKATFSDLAARWIMHGIDQQNGITMVDRLNKYRQRSIKGHLKRITERKIEPNYKIEFDSK